MTARKQPNFPMAEASEWLSRIFAMVIVTLVPILLGKRLDRHFGTEWLVIVGIVLGLVVGLVYLLWITKRIKIKKSSETIDQPPSPPFDDD